MAQELIIASKNAGKIAEFKEVLEPRGFIIKSLLDYPEIPEIEEPYETFYENAQVKARTIADHFGQMVLADDSGLSVDSLGGKPGVYSARYAGPEKDDQANNRKLLADLEGIENRDARFICALVMAHPDGREDLIVQADFSGIILNEERGENGFGYDPLFFVPEANKTSAEMTSQEKNATSHRGRAIEKLLAQLDDWLG